MEKETAILNRFTPGIPNPIFFAGRKEEITEYLFALQDIANHSASHRQRIHILKGENGIGKSSFALRLKKQIQEEMSHYIPIYTSCIDFLEVPAYFYKNFLSSIEECLSLSSFRRELFAKFFRKEAWQQIALKIAPRLVPISHKFNLLESKSQLVKSFVRLLGEAYTTFDHLKELLGLLDWIFQESNLFLFWILDHPEDLKAKPEIEEILSKNLSWIERSYHRYFVLLCPESRISEAVTLPNNNHEGKAFIPLLNRNTFLSIESTESVTNDAIPLLKRLKFQERLSVINILPTLDVDTIARVLKAHCASESMMFKFSASKSEHIAQYIQEMALHLLTEVKEALSKIGDASIFAQEGTTETTKLLKNQIMDVENDLVRMMNFFQEILLRIDANLQNFGNVFLVIFLEDLERFISPEIEKKQDNDSTPSPSVTKKITLIYRNKYTCPSSGFIEFFHFLERCFQKLKKISLVLITKLPQFEIAAASPKDLSEIYERCPSKTLKSLPQVDATHLIKEISARSGVLLSDEIASDLYDRTSGNPLALHHFGHYLLSQLEREIPLTEIPSLKKVLLRKLTLEQTNYRNILQEGPDGRARLSLTKDFYQANVPGSLEDLYQTKLSTLRESSSRNILQTMLVYEGISPKDLQEKCKELGIEIQQEDIDTGIQELKEKKLLLSLSEKSASLDPGFSRFLKKSFSTEEKELQQSQLKTIVREPVKPLLSTKKIKSFPTVVIGGLNTTQKNASSNIEYLEDALEWIEKGCIPCAKILSNVSRYIVLEENSPAFKISASYIYSLCNKLKQNLNLDIDVARIFSIFKDYLLVSLQQQGLPDLFFAIKKSLFGSKGLAKLYPQEIPVSKMYFLLYCIQEDQEDIEKALHSLYDSFKNLPVSTEAKDLLLKMENQIQKGEMSKDKQELLTKIQWTRKLVSIQEIEDINLAKKHLERLTPSFIPTVFHNYFLKFLEKLLHGQSTLMPEIIPLVGFFGNIINDHLEIFYFLIECIEKDVQLGCIAANTLIQLFPYLKEQDRQEIMVGIQEIITKSSNTILCKSILEKIYSAFLLFPSDEQALFFFECLKKEEQEKISSSLWKCLIYLKGMCSEKIQQEILYFLCDYYEKILAMPLSPKELIEYTECLLNTIHKENEIILEPISKIVHILEDCEQNTWRDSAWILSVLYPSLPAQRKKDIRNILERWFLKGDSQKKYFALSHIAYFYENLPNGKEIIQKILTEDFTLTEQILIAQIPSLYPKIDGIARHYIWDTLCELLEKSHSMPLSHEILQSLYKAMIGVCSYHSKEETEILAKNILGLFEQEEKEQILSFVFQNSCCFLPYIKEEWYEKIQNAILIRLISQKNSHEILSALLSFFSFAYPLKIEIPESCLVYIRNQMNDCPSVLLKNALKFFANILSLMPEKLYKDLHEDALFYMYSEDFAQEASIFLIQSQGSIPEPMEWAHRYQFNPSTYSIAFALYEIFPENLSQVPGLLENYEKMRKKSPYLLGLKMADFHRKVAAVERAEELMEWILKYSKMPFMKIKALEQKREWLLCQNRSEEAHKILIEIMKITNP